VASGARYGLAAAHHIHIFVFRIFAERYDIGEYHGFIAENPFLAA
jgi:hypothetical protein